MLSTIPDLTFKDGARSTSLTYTSFAPKNRITEHKLMEIYAFVIIGLNLTEDIPKRYFSLSKSTPFTFTVDQCIEVMANLELNIELANTTSIISYKFKLSLARVLIRKFFNAKLLHCPSDRTLNYLDDLVLLQPTAKGLAIVHKFCKTIGMKPERVPRILLTSHNSMNLIGLDRDTVTDNIVYSDYLVHILFQKMLGKKQNTWSSYNDADPIKILYNEHSTSDDEFCTLNVTVGSSPFSAISNRNLESDHQEPLLQSIKSPYHHRYFTNPDLDSHMQYYTSDMGVRFHKACEFKSGGQNILLHNCLTGKSICQWLCDCTDVLTIWQASEIGALFLKAKLLDPVLFYPSKSNFDRFLCSSNCYYTISKLGKKISFWDTYNNSRIQARMTNKVFNRLKTEIGDDIKFLIDKSNIEYDIQKVNQDEITLEDTLKDPGLRYLFRQHLEMGLCVENLDAYMKLRQFESKISILGKLLDNLSTDDNNHIFELANESMSIAYNIYLTYLNTESPFALNIDYQLKMQVANMLTILNLNPASCAAATYLNTPTRLTSNEDDSACSSSSESAHQTTCGVCTIVSEESSVDNKVNTANATAASEGSKFRRLVSFKNSSKVEKVTVASLTTLANISVSYELIKKQIFRMMEIDSFPKFLESELCTLIHHNFRGIENSKSSNISSFN